MQLLLLASTLACALTSEAPAYSPAPYAPAPYVAPVVHAAPAPYAPAPYVAPVVHAPPAPYHEEIPHDYQFGYDVHGVDNYGNPNEHSRHESRAGNTVKGQYVVHLPDCRTQIVDYFVDEYKQYHADVKYEGVPCPDKSLIKHAVVHAAPAYAPVAHAAHHAVHHAGPLVHAPVAHHAVHHAAPLVHAPVAHH